MQLFEITNSILKKKIFFSKNFFKNEKANDFFHLER